MQGVRRTPGMERAMQLEGVEPGQFALQPAFGLHAHIRTRQQSLTRRSWRVVTTFDLGSHPALLLQLRRSPIAGSSCAAAPNTPGRVR